MSVAIVESLDHEGRGVAHVDGKVVFIEGALPGETVTYDVLKSRSNYAQASVREVIKGNALRVLPRCEYFGHCGGCSMQHLDAAAQTAVKQRVLEDALRHIGGVRPEIIYPSIHGAMWGYRNRTRLTVRFVPHKGGVLIGFHERRSSYVADMNHCAVLAPDVSALLPKLHELVAGLTIVDRIPQIEAVVSGNARVFVLRILRPLSCADEMLLRAFADENGVQIWLQAEGPESAQRFHPAGAPDLNYTLPEFDVSLAFRPTDFTQVNVHTNRLLVRRAIGLLEPRAGERVADLFCGLGNFSLPIARQGADVVGVEGSPALVRRAAVNAAANGLAQKAVFYEANLFEATEDSLAALGSLDKMLIDPPREGAIAVVKALSTESPKRIVYVSCNPATLARDAAVLIHQKGYRLKGAGIANMFPQTSHVESIALFER